MSHLKRDALNPTGLIARTSSGTFGPLAVAMLLAWAGQSVAQAQPQTLSAGIYACVDAKGRKLTSDRPIPECNDREQQVLNPSGTVRSKVGPTLTAQERAAFEAKEKLAAEEGARRDEEKRRDKALLLRYPNKALHDAERAEAVAQIIVVKKAALNRIDELTRQRATIGVEMEFYKKDASKAPSSLRRQVDDVAQSLAVQGRFVTDQDGEISRVNARFDEELARLKQLWPQQAGATTPSSPAPTSATATKAAAKTR